LRLHCFLVTENINENNNLEGTEGGSRNSANLMKYNSFSVCSALKIRFVMYVVRHPAPLT
jgi:hypothetical protein